MSDLAAVKKCPDCGQLKPVSDYGLNKRMADGLARYCKECFRARSKASYRKRMAEKGREVRERPDVPDGFKYCPQCKETKPVADFGRNRAAKSGLTDYCRPCHTKVMATNKVKHHGSTRSYHLKRRYGLTEEEVAALAERHAERCLICLRRRPLHVDHDHSTGDVRGMLCFSCNGALGQFKDDPQRIRRAVDYLEGRLGEPRRPERRPARRRVGERRSSRDYRLTTRYGIGADEVERLIEQQGGGCPICRAPAPAHVDHDHVTGDVRGILCADCNTGMGQLRDDPWGLRRALQYLTGGLMGLLAAGDGGYQVAVVRPRRPDVAVDPGWHLARACTDDLAFLRMLAEGPCDDLWETDVDVTGGEAPTAWFPLLDLSDPDFPPWETPPSAPLGPPESAFCGAD